MAGTKSLIGAALLGAAVTGGTIIPLTGDQYATDAVRVEMKAATVEPTTVFKDKETGEVVALEALPDSVKAEDVIEEQIPERKLPPQMVKFNTFDEKPIVLIPGKKYKISFEADGKILYEADYTPDVADYPKEYRSVWTALVRFSANPDIINDTADANEVARIMGYDIPVDTTKTEK